MEVTFPCDQGDCLGDGVITLLFQRTGTMAHFCDSDCLIRWLASRGMGHQTWDVAQELSDEWWERWRMENL